MVVKRRGELAQAFTIQYWKHFEIFCLFFSLSFFIVFVFILNESPNTLINAHFPDEMKRKENEMADLMNDENKTQRSNETQRKMDKPWVVRWCWYVDSFLAESLFTAFAPSTINHQHHIIIDSKYQSVSGVSFPRCSYLLSP